MFLINKQVIRDGKDSRNMNVVRMFWKICLAILTNLTSMLNHH